MKPLTIFFHVIPVVHCFMPHVERNSRGLSSAPSTAFLPDKRVGLFASSENDDLNNPFSASDLNNSDKKDDSQEKDTVNNDDSFFLESLKNRMDTISKEKSELEHNWQFADFVSSIGFALSDDWVRRISLHNYPIALVGGASGSIYLADLETKETISSVEKAHAQVGGNPEALKQLFGDFDGGGIISLAIRGNILVSAGREGGIKIWTFDGEKINFQGSPASLENFMVTNLQFDENGSLWIASYEDKVIRRYEIDYLSEDKQEIKLRMSTSYTCESEPLSIAVCSDISLCACGLSNGSVLLLSGNGEKLDDWYPFKDIDSIRKKINTRSVGILDNDDGTYHVIAGGSNGRMYMRKLYVGLDGEVSAQGPFDYETRVHEMLPFHNAPVVSIATRKGGLVITGSTDGSLRVWDCTGKSNKSDDEKDTSNEQSSKSLYCLIGYKVWLGSVCIDEEGRRLLSDGSDNTVVVHDFSNQN